ncbi:MAG: hypothetical protein ACXADL_06110 [Candidatus Thorarchaeota archaeon]|jgi:hypothetical protein
MSPRRVFFKEPIVKVGIEGARFPQICPICEDPASRSAKIHASPKKLENPRLAQSKWPRLSSSGTKVILLYVCDEHYQSDEGRENSKIVCMMGNAVVVSLLLFGFMIAGSDLWAGRAINPIFFGLVFSFIIVLIVTSQTFRPGKLESAVKILGFDLGFKNMWLQFGRSGYRDRFMQENPMKAELVNWITKL